MVVHTTMALLLLLLVVATNALNVRRSEVQIFTESSSQVITIQKFNQKLQACQSNSLAGSDVFAQVFPPGPVAALDPYGIQVKLLELRDQMALVVSDADFFENLVEELAQINANHPQIMEQLLSMSNATAIRRDIMSLKSKKFSSRTEWMQAFEKVMGRLESRLMALADLADNSAAVSLMTKIGLTLIQATIILVAALIVLVFIPTTLAALSASLTIFQIQQLVGFPILVNVLVILSFVVVVPLVVITISWIPVVCIQCRKNPSCVNFFQIPCPDWSENGNLTAAAAELMRCQYHDLMATTVPSMENALQYVLVSSGGNTTP